MLQNLAVLLLIVVFFTGNSGSKSICVYKAVGDRVVIQLDNEEILPDNDLTWTHNRQKVYTKKALNVKVKKLNIDHRGSLILENVQKNQSGEYTGQLYKKDGTLKMKKVEQLCVLEPVVKPTVMVNCEENGATLVCKVTNNTEMLVVWIKNGKEKVNMANTVLHVNPSELKRGENFSCTVSNKISKETAKDVQPECFDTGPHATKKSEEEENSNKENKNSDVSEKTFLFGLDLWWMLVALTGGGLFLLILIFICIVCVFRCRKREREEEEYHLAFPVPDHPNHLDLSDQYDQETLALKSSKSQRPLPPIPGPIRDPPCVILSYE